ncbi:syntaxin binding protein 1 [Basidiobolus ranarum]|uniref:Syntaxin binding protein 1 n=1 Tax=Basidiobolus ranarum TaxID=34480 RepID=A0ABR2VVD3_9FUNG
MSEITSISIRQIVRKRFLDILQVMEASKETYILVTDAHSRRLLGEVIGDTEIYYGHIGEVVVIGQGEKNDYSSYNALYLLTPSHESVVHLMEDFQNPQKLRYKSAVVYFISDLDDEYYHNLLSSPAKKYIKSINEVYVDLFTPETRLFDLKLSQSFVRLYSNELEASLPKELEVIAKKIASACYTLKENPIIRYFKPDGEMNTSMISEKLAKAVEKELEHLSVKEKSYLQNTTEPRASLIILDRTLDMKAPLLHDITYQAMAYDMLDISDDRKYMYEITDNTNNVVEKKATLDENDQLWVKYRHSYFADTSKDLVAELNKLTSKQLQNKPGMSPQAMIKQLREAVFQLPDYQEFKEKLSCHLTMLTECKELFQTYNYADLVPLEQILATGEDIEGNAAKHMLEDVIHLVRGLDNDDNRLRLLLLYLISKDGIREEHLQTIREQAGVLENSEDDLVLNNIKHMGVKVLKVMIHTL